MNYLTHKYAKPAIIIGIIVAILLVFIPIFSGTYNRVVTLEENVNTSVSNISKEEQRRVDLFNNLVDAVENARDFEQATLIQLTEARGQANQGNVEEAMLTIAAVVEAYPEIKSIALYDKAMTEFSVTENRLAGYREQYNTDVRSYNRKVRSFPSNLVLAVMGYDKQDFKYLDFEVNNAEARNLFN
jgi:LemA protein